MIRPPSVNPSPQKIEIYENCYIPRAIELATAAHSGTTRGDGKTPYIEHPRAVAQLVTTCGGRFETVAAAWLHDTVEDTSLTLSEIADLTCPEIAAQVKKVTFPNAPNRRELMLEALPKLDIHSRLIKLADIVVNMRDLPNATTWSAERQKRYYQRLVEQRTALTVDRHNCHWQGLWMLEKLFDLYAANPLVAHYAYTSSVKQ